jgi:hypothetical protein
MATNAYLAHEDGTRCPGAECQECPNSTCGCHTVDCGQYFKMVRCVRHAMPQSNGFLESVKLADVSLEVLESFAARIGGGLSLVDYKTCAECEFTPEDVRTEITRRKSQPKKRETDQEKFARLSRIPIELVSAEEKHFLKYCRLPAELRPRFTGTR